MLGSKQREIDRLTRRNSALEKLLRRTQVAMARLTTAVPAQPGPSWLDDLAAWRRVVVDHIVTGLAHPDPAVRTQALALQTELDVAGLNVDADIKTALASTP